MMRAIEEILLSRNEHKSMSGGSLPMEDKNPEIITGRRLLHSRAAREEHSYD